MAPHADDTPPPSAIEPTNTGSNDIVDRNEPKYEDYIQWKPLSPRGPLNRWSQALTRGHDFPGAQAMLYAAGVPNEEMMKNAPHVGIATVWWEGNPCK